MARGIYRLFIQLAIPMIQIIDSAAEISFELHPRPLPGYDRVLELHWGYGAFELPFDIEREPSGSLGTGLSSSRNYAIANQIASPTVSPNPSPKPACYP
jgi:hypothetical protein